MGYFFGAKLLFTQWDTYLVFNTFNLLGYFIGVIT